MHCEDVRLRVHLVLESEGERIAEIKTDRVFPDLIDPGAMAASEALLQRCLEVDVNSPARGLVRGHILRLREQTSFKRKDTVPPDDVAAWPRKNAPELDATVSAYFREMAT